MSKVVIIATEDESIALFHCGICGRPFWAEIARVASIQNTALCLPCVEQGNKDREGAGMPPFAICRDAYRSDLPLPDLKAIRDPEGGY